MNWVNFLFFRCLWWRLPTHPLDLLLGSLAVFYYQDAFIFVSAREALQIWKGLSCYLASHWDNQSVASNIRPLHCCVAHNSRYGRARYQTILGKPILV